MAGKPLDITLHPCYNANSSPHTHTSPSPLEEEGETRPRQRHCTKQLGPHLPGVQEWCLHQKGWLSQIHSGPAKIECCHMRETHHTPSPFNQVNSSGCVEWTS